MGSRRSTTDICLQVVKGPVPLLCACAGLVCEHNAAFTCSWPGLQSGVSVQTDMGWLEPLPGGLAPFFRVPSSIIGSRWVWLGQAGSLVSLNLFADFVLIAAFGAGVQQRGAASWRPYCSDMSSRE